MNIKSAARRSAATAAGALLLAGLVATNATSTPSAHPVGQTTAGATLASASRRPQAHMQGAAPANLSGIAGYSNGFETNTAGWCNFVGSPPCDGTPGGFNYGTVTRVGNGTSLAPYGMAINGEAGLNYATVNGTGISAAGCPTFPAQDESCTGPFTTWNNPNGNYFTFPTKGMATGLDIYLDTAWAESNPGNEFEWDVALNHSGGGFLQDYIFTAETFSAATAAASGCPSATSAGFVVGFSANTNNDPGSGNGSLGPYTPACITDGGWYRFQHRFYKFNQAGLLGVEMSIVQHPSNSVVADFTSTPQMVSDAGGPAYGWFPNENIPGLPIDNVKLKANS